MSEIKNAKITATSLGYEDHGILTAFLTVEGDGWDYGFGGYAMDEWNEVSKERVGTTYGCQFIVDVLKTVGVDSWEKLNGAYVRVDSEGWGGKIRRIGHITKDVWFDPKALAEKMKERDK